jgi:hypothetical protein
MLTCQVPPYACSFVVSIVCSYLCDKYKKRGVMAIGSSLLAAAGYAIFLGKQHLSSKKLMETHHTTYPFRFEKQARRLRFALPPNHWCILRRPVP